jgi:hypothetical protein
MSSSSTESLVNRRRLQARGEATALAGSVSDAGDPLGPLHADLEWRTKPAVKSN